MISLTGDRCYYDNDLFYPSKEITSNSFKEDWRNLRLRGCVLRLVETFWLVETFASEWFQLQLKVINKNLSDLYDVWVNQIN